MRILVTGGAGFIGSHIVDQYVEAGHDVFVVDDLSSGRRQFVNSRAVFYKDDICDRTRIGQIMAEVKPELLNHHAAQMEVRKSVADPAFDAQVNIIGLLNLMEEGRKHGLKRVIFASSGGAVYGDTDTLPTPESYPAQPVSPYGISKLASEYYLSYYTSVHGIESITLRYGNVYGPRQNPHGEAGVVAIFTQKLLANSQPIINGDGNQTRDFVYVEDVAAANVLALKATGSLTVNIGTMQETNVNQIFDELVRITGVEKARGYGEAKKGEQRRSSLDTTLAKEKLSWQTTIPLAIGLAKTVAYFQNENPTK